jgi:hypothetical protein
LGANFGAETIDGFATTGANSDTIELATSSFSHLTAGMSQAQISQPCCRTLPAAELERRSRTLPGTASRSPE